MIAERFFIWIAVNVLSFIRLWKPILIGAVAGSLLSIIAQIIIDKMGWRKGKWHSKVY